MRTLLVIAGILLLVLLQGYLLPPYTPAPALPATLAGDGQWQHQAEQLALFRLPLYVAELVLPPLVLWSFIRRGSAARLQRRLRERGLRSPWLLVGAYGLLLWLGLALLVLPLHYAGYMLRRAYGLSNEPLLDWLGRQALETAIQIGPAIVALEGLYWLLRTFPRGWWILASAGTMLLSLFFVYISPIVITPLLYTQRPLDDAVLRTKIVELATRIGVKVDEIYVIDASTQGIEANAYVTGIGGSTRIVLYDTLLANYPQDEVLAVLAHEMGHWYLFHIWQGLILSFLAAPFGFLIVHRLLRRVLPRWGIRRSSDVAGLPFLLLLLSIVTITTLPGQNWLSRRWEAEADQIALIATGNDPAVARLFARLARQNLTDPAPPRLVETLFATHPAIGRRVAAALAGSANP
jgi:STE24 endopeptidase